MAITRKNQTRWQDELSRKLQVYRMILLHGNVRDTFYDRNDDGENIVERLRGIVQEENVPRKIIIWSQKNGIDAEPDVLNDLRQDVQTFCNETISTDSNDAGNNRNSGNNSTSGSTVYDLDDDNYSTSSNVEQSLNAPIRFFNYLRYRFTRKNARQNAPYVFVIDWADTLFGNVTSLSEEERVMVQLLGDSVRSAEASFEPELLEKAKDTLVLIAGRQESIPSFLYVDMPATTSVYVPLPDRDERSVMLKKYGDAFRCQNENSVTASAMESLIDELEGRPRRDIYQIARLSRVDGLSENLTHSSLMRLYKYGQKQSPWEQLNRERVEELESILGEQVKGQEHVIRRIGRVFRLATVGLSGLHHSSKQQMPKGIFFFVGPTGVGKTEMAKALARFLFRDEDACIRFDMSEYSQENSDQRLIGAPPGFVGYEAGGQLTNAIRKHPFSVLLFDEIEKAHWKILDKFLQILEDGRLTDGKGETVSFSESVIIFTSNIGAAEVSPDQENLHEWFRNRVREHFTRGEHPRPELLNRIGEENILPFNFITDVTVQRSILMAKFEPLNEKIQEKFGIHNIEIQNEDKIFDGLRDGFNPAMGGRGIGSVFMEKIVEPLSDWLFVHDSELMRGCTLVISQPLEKLRFQIR